MFAGVRGIVDGSRIVAGVRVIAGGSRIVAGVREGELLPSWLCHMVKEWHTRHNASVRRDRVVCPLNSLWPQQPTDHCYLGVG